jgi:hypothetical protein
MSEGKRPGRVREPAVGAQKVPSPDKLLETAVELAGHGALREDISAIYDELLTNNGLPSGKYQL